MPVVKNPENMSNKELVSSLIKLAKMYPPKNSIAGKDMRRVRLEILRRMGGFGIV